MTAAEWIATRRELLAAATEKPWRASLLDGVRYEDGSSSYRCGIYPGATQGTPPVFVTNGIDTRDAALIADARSSLPRALDALEALLKAHRPVSFSFSWRDGVAMHEVCPGCQDKAGTHPCGCWRDEDQPHVCAVCSDPEHRMDAPWPCMTVQAIETALRGDS